MFLILPCLILAKDDTLCYYIMIEIWKFIFEA